MGPGCSGESSAASLSVSHEPDSPRRDPSLAAISTFIAESEFVVIPNGALTVSFAHRRGRRLVTHHCRRRPPIVCRTSRFALVAVAPWAHRLDAPRLAAG